MATSAASRPACAPGRVGRGGPDPRPHRAGRHLPRLSRRRDDADLQRALADRHHHLQRRPDADLRQPRAWAAWITTASASAAPGVQPRHGRAGHPHADRGLQPDEIYTVSHFDMHGDHQATALFVTEALVALKRSGVALSTKLHQGIVWPPSQENWPEAGGVLRPTRLSRRRRWTPSSSGSGRCAPWCSRT